MGHVEEGFVTEDTQCGCTINPHSEEFSGFLPVKDLRHQLNCIPGEPGHIGIYVVLRTQKAPPIFKETGSGGHFKGRNPNVEIGVLESHWVENADVLYIGKAGGTENQSTLRCRLQAFLAFGNEKRVAHWGGRFIWQLEDHEDLLVCWKLAACSTPRELEETMIRDFKRKHHGRRPFANLRD